MFTVGIRSMSWHHPTLPAPPRATVRRWGVPIPVRAVLSCLIPHVWVGVVFLVVVLRHLLLLTLGQAITGQITDQTLRQGKDTHYSIAYTYTDGGQRYTDETSVSESAGRDMVRGSAVRVTALHRFGVSRSHIPGAEGPMGPWGWTIGFTLFWNTITFAVVIGFVLDPLRHRWMVRYGQAAQGQVTGSTVKKGKSTT
jgi:hypothetical protein